MPYSARDAPVHNTSRATQSHAVPHTHTTPRLHAEGRQYAAQTRPTSGKRPSSGVHHQPRPDSVPKLSLGKLITEDDPDITLNMDPYSYKLDSPATPVVRSTHGTQPHATPSGVAADRKLQDLQHYSKLSAQRCNNGQSHHTSHREAGYKSGRSARHEAPFYTQPTAWDRAPLPEDLPAPPQHYKTQYQKLQQELRDDYRAYSDRGISTAAVEQQIEQLRLDIPVFDPQDEDDQKDRLQKDWTTQPYSKAAQIRRQDKDSLEDINRKKKLIETVMIDQLSRPVISRPEGAAVSSRITSHRHMKRGSVRTLHESKVTTGTATENLLSKRVQFGARVLSRVGRDALKELTGFYFAVDNSITVYEFRQFGKSAKALPFIQRGTYCHLSGSREGQPYTLNEIKQGECLMFDTRDQPVPDTMKVKVTVILKVTETDDNAKAEILLHGVATADQDDVWRRAHIPQTKDEVTYKYLLIQVQDCVRSQIRKRGIKVYTGLSALYHKLDEAGDGQLNKVELDKSLIDYHIDVPQDHFDDLWDALDTESTGFMDYAVFLRAYLGEMSERRKALVCKAFRKMDVNKQGQVTFDEVKKFFNAHKHPRVRSRECTEAEIIENFLYHFSNTATRGVITFYEFENYYEGLSVCIESEEDFD